MITALCVLCGVLSLALFYSSGKFEERRKDGISWALFLLGIGFLCLFGVNSFYVFQDGSPLIQIPPGVYKVGFVYQAGHNVNIGIEKEGEVKEARSTVNGVRKVEKYKTEHLFLYQFPVKDFEGDVLLDAHKLVAYKIVTSEGTFNKYKLGYNIVQLQ